MLVVSLTSSRGPFYTLIFFYDPANIGNVYLQSPIEIQLTRLNFIKTNAFYETITNY